MAANRLIWHTELWRPVEGESWQGAIGGNVWPGVIALETVGDVNYGTLFAYMFRRFGPSIYGSDDEKDIALWYLTTPDPSVALWVTPRPSGCRHSFGYMVKRSEENDKRWSEGYTEKVTTALKATIMDLMYPTHVRDVFINAAGTTKDTEQGICKYFKWAGYGIDHEYFENLYREG